jgi:predicted transcriptional regulator
LDRIDHSKTCCTHELPRLSDGERQKILRRLVRLDAGLNIDETPEMLAAIDAGMRSIETGPGVPLEEARQRLGGWITCSRGYRRILNDWSAGRIRTCASRWNRLIALASMIHHVVLYKLRFEVTPARVEAMMMNTRMQLLKIPEVLSIKCGKRVDPELPWPFFIAIDFESMDKYAIFREDPVFVKFMEEIIKPNTADSLTLDFEMDPGKDVRFS